MIVYLIKSRHTSINDDPIVEVFHDEAAAFQFLYNKALSRSDFILPVPADTTPKSFWQNFFGIVPRHQYYYFFPDHTHYLVKWIPGDDGKFATDNLHPYFVQLEDILRFVSSDPILADKINVLRTTKHIFERPRLSALDELD